MDISMCISEQGKPPALRVKSKVADAPANGRALIRQAAIAMGLLTVFAPSYAVDSASFELGTGYSSQIARIAVQSNFERRWWQSNGTHIGGYWDLSLAQWRENRFQNIPGNTHNLTSIGLTPVFRFQKDSLLGPYVEAGIGAHYLSSLYDNSGRQLSTRFEFGDHVGVGYVFRNKLDVGLKLQHFSNGGIREPNNGANFVVVRISYPL